MLIYLIAAFSLLAVVCLSAVIAQNARKFDYEVYLTGADFSVNLKQLALALKDVEKVGAVPDVNATVRRIRRAYTSVCSKVKRGEKLFECEKWLYENFRSVTLGVRRNNYKDFAALPHRGEARVVHLAKSVVSRNYGKVDAQSVSDAVREFCRYTPLTYGEICALKGAFEVALLKNVEFVCRKIRAVEKAKKRAEEDREPDVRMSKREGYLHFYIAAGKKIPDKFIGRNTEINIENVDFAFAGAMSDYAQIIGNAVSSLKSLGDFMTEQFIVSLSPINGYIESDKSYCESDCASKKQYLAAISELARYFNVGEYAVAKGAFDLAARFDVHFGEIIFDYRYALRSHLKGKYVNKLKRTQYRLDKTLYYCSVFLLQAVFALLSGIFLPPVWLRITVSSLVFVAAYPSCAYIAERVIAFFLPKRPVPRLNYAEIPPEGATAVVVSHYLTNPQSAKKAVDDMLALRAVNDGKNVYFFLLCDLAESDSEENEKDNEIIKELSKGEKAENFAVLVRKRVAIGKKYGAYERKRGAVMDFNECMISGDTSKFRYVSRPFDFKAKYVMLLDADSRIGAGQVRTAVNTIMHPLNAKYNLMTFSSVYSLSSLVTPYSEKFYESAGAQTYCDYDDFYFNLTSKAIFCGKGIYDLEAFHEKTSAVIPDGKVLSHDIIEGAIMNTGSLNLAVAEDAPDTFVSDVSRRNRWMRGDLLLLPFVGKKYCSDGIYSYLILKNAFSYLSPCAALALWIIALSQGYALTFAGVFFACFSAPLASLAISVSQSVSVKSSENFRRILKTVLTAVLDVLLLPFYATVNLAVAARTFFDYIFNSGAMLKWKPFATLQGISGYGRHAATVAPSCMITAILAAVFYGSPAVAVYALLFIATVNFLAFACKKRKDKPMAQQDKAVLTGYARDTYAYFNELSGDSLPCDNIQIYPPKGKSATTSPTNIGYALLAEICAAELGIKTVAAARQKILALIQCCEKLEKWKGHLYNWYDVCTLKPVNPYFVSSVDSGNYIAALISCKGFFKASGFDDDAERCEKLIDETDFSALIDRDKNQLFIGYNVGAKRYEGHYDLLASESRLTAYIACCIGKDSTLWNGFSRVQVNSKGNVLASWSGTAFEYLMPQLFLADVRNSLITSSVKRAVNTFVSRKCNGLWGISESGYYAFDADAKYQYRAHGLGELALRNESDRCVITPYASALALRYVPEKALRNLSSLRNRGVYGDYGFYEAMDFSAGRNTVSSAMTHHQGMILCSIVNALKDDAIIRYFMSDNTMAGGKLMLEEKQLPCITKRTAKRDFIYFGSRNNYAYTVNPGEFPRICMLRGREYSVVIDDYGCGYSQWRDKDINVFSTDYYKNSGGFGYFICDGQTFSPTFAPLKTDGGSCKVIFGSDFAKFENFRHNCNLKIFTPTVVSGEVREYTVKNDSDKLKNYQFVFAERTALSGREEYAAHPAFCDLFVNARFDRSKNTLYMKRKPRESTGGFILAATMLAGTDVYAECNRQNLLGRNHDESNPALDFGGENPSLGDVITPCLGLKCAFTLAPGQSKKIAVIIQCSDDESTLENRVNQVISTDFLSYASKPVEDGDGYVLSKYLPDEESALFAGKLAAKLLYEPYPKSALLARLQNPQTLSFNEKTLILDYDSVPGLAKKAVKSAIACRLCGIDLRLVVLYDESDGYNGETAAEICNRVGVSDLKTLPFVTFIDKNAYKPQEIKNLVLQSFFRFSEREEDNVRRSVIAVRRRNGQDKFIPCKLPAVYRSGNGGFDENGDYYVFSKPQLPYSNVVSTLSGGFVATENGGGFCYFLNSQSNKLSGWSNDPVADAPYERLLVSEGEYVVRVNKLNHGGYVRHSKGSTTYVSRTEKAGYKTEKYLAMGGKIQVIALTVSNHGDKTLSAEVSYVMSPCQDTKSDRSFIFCEKEGKDALKAVNVKTGKSFYLLAKDNAEILTDCEQVLSRGINGFNPKRSQSRFNNPICGASIEIRIEKSSEKTLIFAICDSEESLAFARINDISLQREQSKNNLSDTGSVKLISSDRSLDLLFANLPYQVRASRICGKCGFYQAGGAIGFRDQLQDCLALLWSDPAAVREHILRCAERQYIEGDVMHWWHAPAFGVRTRISDDRLFLPYVACEYVAHTGDDSILGEKCAYLIGEPLDDLQEARLEHGKYAGVEESLLLHMQRAIDSALVKGEHGLLLIGGGDWNDALNEIGLRGRGESVWLTQFAIDVIEKFCAYIDKESAKRYYKIAADLRCAVQNAFFDDRWARAFTDKGEWLGTKKSKGCKNDLISQCWAQIVFAGTQEQRKSAMCAAKSLIDENAGAVRLFSPPFDGKVRYGYISSYPQGVRENGGQYTHAAVWYLLACCKAGDKEEANRVLKMLNPVERCRDKDKNAAYKAEPYVLAGDVYTSEDNVGRAGWTWYTGSAAWLYKVILEEMLGIKKRGDSLVFSPPLLDKAQDARAEYVYEGTTYVIGFENSGMRGIRQNGVNYTNCSVLPLKKNRGRIEITVLF